MKQRDGTPVSDLAVWLYFGCVFGTLLLIVALRSAPPRWHPYLAMAAWLMVVQAAVGEVFAGGRSDLLKRTRAFALAGAAVYGASLLLVSDSSAPQLIWIAVPLLVLLTAEAATTGLDVVALAFAAMQGTEPTPVSRGRRWICVAVGAYFLLRFLSAILLSRT